MKRSFWLSILAYVLPTFPLGYVWHLVTARPRTARWPEIRVPHDPHLAARMRAALKGRAGITETKRAWIDLASRYVAALPAK